MPKKKTKRSSKCAFKECKKRRLYSNSRQRINGRFCQFHCGKSTINSFLSKIYKYMKGRTNGKCTRRPDLYKGLPIMPIGVFKSWAKNHSDFLNLYKQWVTNNFDRKLTPTVNRVNSSKGYTLDNVEWMTNSQNCGLSGGVKKMNQKKAIYDLLGVNNVK